MTKTKQGFRSRRLGLRSGRLHGCRPLSSASCLRSQSLQVGCLSAELAPTGILLPPPPPGSPHEATATAGWVDVTSRRRRHHASRPRSVSVAPRRSNINSAFLRRLSGRCCRCLASDHRAASCRDPVRCLSCLRSGHKERDCRLRHSARVRQPCNSPPPRAPSRHAHGRSWAEVAASAPRHSAKGGGRVHDADIFAEDGGVDIPTLLCAVEEGHGKLQELFSTFEASLRIELRRLSSSLFGEATKLLTEATTSLQLYLERVVGCAMRLEALASVKDGVPSDHQEPRFSFGPFSPIWRGRSTPPLERETEPLLDVAAPLDASPALSLASTAIEDVLATDIELVDPASASVIPIMEAIPSIQELDDAAHAEFLEASPLDLENMSGGITSIAASKMGSILEVEALSTMKNINTTSEINDNLQPKDLTMISTTTSRGDCTMLPSSASLLSVFQAAFIGECC